MVDNGIPKRRRRRFATSMVPVCLAGAVLVAGCSSHTPAQRVQQAQQAYQKHDYHAAEVQLKSLLQDHPDNGAAWALLGHTSLATRQYDDAIHQFKKARANGQPAAAVALPLGRALVASGQYQQALDALQVEGSDTPDHVRALVASLRGDAQAGLGNRDKAAHAYAAALAIEPALPDALQGKARLALHSGDMQGAHAALAKAVAAHPDDVGSLVLLGQVDYQSNRCNQAIAKISHAMEVGRGEMSGSEQQSARALLADCQLRTGDAKGAQQNIDAILAANQNNPFGNYLQALMDIRQGAYQDAANHVQATLNVDPNNLRSMTLMAWIRIAENRPQDAQPFLTRVLARAPDDMAALRLQAGLWMAQNRGAQAQDLLQQAYHRHPDQPGLHQALSDVASQLKQAQNGDTSGGIDNVSLQLDLARSLAGMGSQAAAQAVLSKIQPKTDAQRREVESAQVRIALATGNRRGAVQRAESLAESHPDDAALQVLLAQSYIAAGGFDKAGQVLARAHRSHPDDAGVIRAQAQLAAQRGHYDEAVQALVPLQQAHPDNSDLTLALAGLYARAGQPSKGIDLLQTAVKRAPDSDTLNQALARAYLSNGQIDSGLELIRARLKTSDDAPAWLHLEGVAQLMNGDTRTGLATLAEAADKAPDQPELGLDVAKAELVSGHTDKAIERLQQLRRQSPDFWPAAGFLALAQAGEGHVDAALAQATDLRQAGHTFDADVLDGDILRTAGRFQQAEAAYAKAYQSRPSARLATAEFNARRAGRMADPAQPLEQWLARAPGDADVALLLASWYQQNGQANKAITLYKKVLAAHPGAVVALNNLALLNATTDPSQAIAYARKAHQAAPDSAAVTDTLGWLLVGQGQLDSGIDLLNAADQAVEGKHPEIRFHLGAALAKRAQNEDKSRAETLLKQALTEGLSGDDASRAHVLINDLKAKEPSEDKAG